MTAQDQQIIDLAKSGVPPREIRHRLEPPATMYHIYGVISAARDAGEPIQRFNTTGFRPTATAVFVARDHYEAINGAAQKRGISRAELVRRLMTVIVRDKLLDAILDDGGRQ